MELCGVLSYFLYFSQNHSWGPPAKPYLFGLVGVSELELISATTRTWTMTSSKYHQKSPHADRSPCSSKGTYPETGSLPAGSTALGISSLLHPSVIRCPCACPPQTLLSPVALAVSPMLVPFDWSLRERGWPEHCHQP